MLNAGGWYANNKRINVVAPCNDYGKSCKSLDRWVEYWDSYENKIALRGTSKSVVYHEGGHANLTYSNKNRRGWSETKQCRVNISGYPRDWTTTCCKSALGCYRAINEGQADFFKTMIERMYQGRTCTTGKGNGARSLDTNATIQTVFKCSKGQTHNMGSLYNLIWSELYMHPQTNKGKIVRLFHNHLPLLSYDDNFITAGKKILNLAKQLKYSDQVKRLIKDTFKKRGLNI